MFLKSFSNLASGPVASVVASSSRDKIVISVVFSVDFPLMHGEKSRNKKNLAIFALDLLSEANGVYSAITRTPEMPILRTMEQKINSF